MVLLSTAYFPPLSWFALAARDMTLSPDRVFPSVTGLEACENYQKQSYRNRCYILAGDGPQMLQVPVVHGSNGLAPLPSLPIPGRLVHRESSITEGGSVPERKVSPLNICSVRVDYSTPWIVRTERALDTAYETSAYYDYYRDSLFPLLEARPDTLWELNLSLLRWCMDRCGIACNLVPTERFCPPGGTSLAGQEGTSLAGPEGASLAGPGGTSLTGPEGTSLTGPEGTRQSSAEGMPADDYRYVIHPKRPDTILRDLGLERPYYQVFRDRLGGFTPRLSILDLLFNEGPGSIRWLTRPVSPMKP